MPCSGIGIGGRWEKAKALRDKRAQKKLDAWLRLLAQSRK